MAFRLLWHWIEHGTTLQDPAGHVELFPELIVRKLKFACLDRRTRGHRQGSFPRRLWS